MLSPSERKKSSNFAKTLLPSFGAEMKKYEEVYADYSSGGYTKELCEHYADVFINDVKKPQAEDIVQVASLYDRIHDSKSAGFYLDMLMERKLSGDDKFGFCIEVLKAKSKLGHWRDADDFRTSLALHDSLEAENVYKRTITTGVVFHRSPISELLQALVSYSVKTLVQWAIDLCRYRSFQGAGFYRMHSR